MWLSFGYLDRALDAAGRAVEIDPRQSRTQSVLGYAYLTQIDTEKAKKALGKLSRSIRPTPCRGSVWGLPLSEMAISRQAVPRSKSPRSSIPIIHSSGAILAKPTMRKNRKSSLHCSTGLPEEELDPLDPTPWLYDAMLKQSLNRPVEALQDLQKSIELNGNRAVYRSRLLLDEDIAMRSAELAHIYDNLGFAQLSLVEGLKSLNADPANYSAHRFLADVYATLPRHELARVSEALQSKLLQPININPLRPSSPKPGFSCSPGQLLKILRLTSTMRSLPATGAAPPKRTWWRGPDLERRGNPVRRYREGIVQPWPVPLRDGRIQAE